MALAPLKSIAHDDEDMFDLAKGMPDDWTPPEYPSGCCFTISQTDLEKAGGEGGDLADVLNFSAMGEATSIFRDMDDCRIELEITEFAGPDGKFFTLQNPAHICLRRSQLEKIDLGEDAERGDFLHMVGIAHIAHMRSDEYGGDMVGLQITHLSYLEDESTETRTKEG